MREADIAVTGRARGLRRSSTDAEQKLWLALRDRRLGEYKFVRQAPVGRFFGDFVCRSRKLVVEVDGATHSSEGEVQYDRRRDSALRNLGYRVLRVTNSDVIENLDGVLVAILSALESRG